MEKVTQKQLFKKYELSIPHRSIWSSNDDWNSVELYRMMKGTLPTPDDMSLLYVLEFLDKKPNTSDFNFVSDPIVTAKKMIYRYSDYFLQELNGIDAKDLK